MLTPSEGPDSVLALLVPKSPTFTGRLLHIRRWGKERSVLLTVLGSQGKRVGERGVSPEDGHGPSETPSLGGGAGDACTLQGSRLDTQTALPCTTETGGEGVPMQGRGGLDVGEKGIRSGRNGVEICRNSC